MTKHNKLIEDKVEAKCVFCDIANRAGVDVIDIEPLNPVVKGHRIVFSARHSRDFADNDAILVQVMLHAAAVARKLEGDYNLITSKGSAATQTVFHLHVHLVPRKEGDGLALPWTGQKQFADLLATREAQMIEAVEKAYYDSGLRISALFERDEKLCVEVGDAMPEVVSLIDNRKFLEALAALRSQHLSERQTFEVVEAPGDRCGNTRKLADGTACPGCRACQ